ncbi:MAG: hypothetical protein JO347_05620 [Candidatus Eremiobacteraeota bacterium]|nr:hypothetical protein [Candidatus Eremiobacteraeota bacterium]
MSAAREIDVLALFLAGAIQGAATLPPPWQQSAPASQTEYARYTRAEPDGTTSIVTASSNVCDCQPADAVHQLSAALNQISGVTVKSDVTTMCGQTAQHLVALGVARPDIPTRRNVDVFFFRQGKSMYAFTYTFTAAAPLADAEKAMSSFCPAP